MNVLLKKRLITALLFALYLTDLFSQTKNGFDLSGSLIDINQIFQGGPPRDGIPSLSNPEFIPVYEVDYLHDDDIVIGLVRGNKARAYPTRILIWHEIVNDIIEGDHVTITYCPLCGTSMVFDSNAGGKIRDFGVSGLLYQSDVLMYDRETESLWSQLEMKAVSGREAGKKLTWLSSEYMSWKSWREKYPAGEVLSTDTGYNRNYGGNAYAGYFASDRTMFPVPVFRDELENKDKIIGIIINDRAKAFPLDSFKNSSFINESVGDTSIRIAYDISRKYPVVLDSKGRNIPFVVSFWFAWQAFYPDTELWIPD